MREDGSVISNREHPDADAADAPRINPLHLVTLEPCFMHREKDLSTLIQKFLVGSKMSAIQMFGESPGLKP